MKLNEITADVTWHHIIDAMFAEGFDDLVGSVRPGHQAIIIPDNETSNSTLIMIDADSADDIDCIIDVYSKNTTQNIFRFKTQNHHIDDIIYNTITTDQFISKIESFIQDSTGK